MRLPPGGAVTGWAALRLAGGGFFDGLAPDGRTELDVPLVLPPGRDIRRGPGFRVVRERLADADLTVLHGIPCTIPARAVFDEMRRCHDVREAVVALDMALVAQLVAVAQFDRFLADKAGWSRVPVVRAARDLCEARSRSPQETRMRLIWVLDAQLPRPHCNWPVADSHGVAIGSPDLLCEELAVIGEFDGADHRRRARHRVDVRREDAFRRTGLECFTLVGADLDDVDLVVDRMRAAVARARLSSVPRTWRTKRDPGPLW